MKRRFDYVVKLPVAPRAEHGIKTVCCECHKDIVDTYFLGGISPKKGKNMMLHERCWNGTGEQIGENWDTDLDAMLNPAKSAV